MRKVSGNEEVPSPRFSHVSIRADVPQCHQNGWCELSLRFVHNLDEGGRLEQLPQQIVPGWQLPTGQQCLGVGTAILSAPWGPCVLVLKWLKLAIPFWVVGSFGQWNTRDLWKKIPEQPSRGHLSQHETAPAQVVAYTWQKCIPISCSVISIMQTHIPLHTGLGGCFPCSQLLKLFQKRNGC